MTSRTIPSARRRKLMATLAWAPVATSVDAQTRTPAATVAATPGVPIRIGEINSYSTMPQFALPYRKGWELAVAQANANGGVLGRRVDVVSRDDAGRPDEAVRQAADLVGKMRVDLLAGTFSSGVGLAVSDFAARQRVLFVAGEPLTDALVWKQGNRYTFRLRPSTYMQAGMLVDEAARLPARRWACIAPDDEYGHAAVADFRSLLKSRRPEVEFVADLFAPRGGLDAASALQSLVSAHPDAVFNASYSIDMVRLVREGNARGVFPRLPVVSLLTGEPEYLDALRDDTPVDWIVTGYPSDVETSPHQRFAAAYLRRHGEAPMLGSVVGYAMMQAVFAGIRKAEGTSTERMVTALRGLAFETPFGPVRFRANDHQSTMGAFVGRLALRDGRGVMTQWRYADGADYVPGDAEVATWRPAEAMR